jgi:DNA-binding NarL/FixJ family response regulator
MSPYVLIVDADASAAQVTRAFVQRIAPEATIVVEQTPERARKALELSQPEVLIIDPIHHSPTSYRLIHQLRQKSPAARVVVLASKPTPTLRVTMQALHVDAYLEKTAALPLLMSSLQVVFEREAVPLVPAFNVS